MIYLCGVGMRVGQMTLEACAALKGCEKIFCVNLPEETFGQIKRMFRRAQDATAGRSAGSFSEEKTCGHILSAGRGRGVGVIFMGHPLLYSMAPQLIRLCRSKGLRYRVMAGLSSVDCALTCLEASLRRNDLDLYGAGFAVYNSVEIKARGVAWEPGRSAILLNLFRLQPAGLKSLAAGLARAYGPAQPAYLIECSEEPFGDRCIQTTVGDLAHKKNSITSRTTLIVPMRRK